MPSASTAPNALTPPGTGNCAPGATSSRGALSSITTKRNSTMIAPA